jgi:uncharacterized protein (TIGR02117 family)
MGLVGVAALVPVCYVALALAFLLVKPDSNRQDEGPTTVAILACDNGVHTDVVVPLVAAGIDWRTFFGPSAFDASALATMNFVGFGWGSREFYLRTPRWRDVRWDLALRALFWDRTVIHVEYLDRPRPGGRCKEWRADAQAYGAFAQFVRASLELNLGRPVLVAGGYGRGDAFFAARGRYTIVRTCNQWSGEALSRAGAPIAPWTPFSFMVAWHLPALGERP